MDDTADMNKPNKARGPRSAEDRVKGLLVMLPWLVQGRRAVPLTEMAEHFGMSVQHLVKDLELATLCGRPPYTPDQYIELIIDEDTVFVSMPRFIENAPALTIAEGLAVLTALKSVQLIPGGASAVATNSLMAKLVTWGQTFDESRLRMLNALDDFYIQGVETSIPLYKTILNSEEYKSGQLSTDFLKRFEMIERLEKDLVQDRKDKQIPAIASALMHSEFYKSKIQSQNSANQNWKNKMDGV